MANIPVTEKTHEKVIELTIEVGYPIKRKVTQNDLIGLLIRSTTVDEIVELWKKENIPNYNSDISTNEIPAIPEMIETDEE